MNSSIMRVHGSVTESMIIVRVCDIYEVSKCSATVLSIHIICYFLFTMFFFFSMFLLVLDLNSIRVLFPDLVLNLHFFCSRSSYFCYCSSSLFFILSFLFMFLFLLFILYLILFVHVIVLVVLVPAPLVTVFFFMNHLHILNYMTYLHYIPVCLLPPGYTIAKREALRDFSASEQYLDVICHMNHKGK